MDFSLLYLAAFLIPLPFNSFGADLFEIPKQSYLLVFLGIALLTISIYIWKKKKLELWSHPLISAGIIFWLTSLSLSSLFGIAPLESFWGGERLQGLFSAILYVIHFFICLQLLRHEKTQKIFFKILLGVGVFISLHALLQYFHLDPLALGDINEASGRSYSTLGQPNLLGQWLIFPIIVALLDPPAPCLPAGWPLKGGVRSPLVPVHRGGRGLGGPLILLFSSALLTTFNRASILGISISLGIFFLSKLPWKTWKKISLSAFTIILLSGILMASGGTRSLVTRSTLIRDSLPLVQKYPLLGSGPETFYQTFERVGTKDLYLSERLFDIPDRVHNEALQVLLDQGLVGLLLYASAFAILLWGYVKKEKKSPAGEVAFYSLLASLIAVQFGFSMTAQIVTLLSMLAIVVNDIFSLKKFTIPITSVAGRLMIVGLGLLLFLGLEYRAYSIVRADIAFGHGVESYFSNSEQSLQDFKEAVKLSPFYRNYLYHAISFISAGEVRNTNVQQTLADFVEQLGQLTKESFHTDLSRATIAQAMGQPEAAERSLASASEKAPNWPYVWLLWGDFEFQQQHFREAIEKYERLISLAPPTWTWECDHKKHSFEDQEKLRIFKKGHALFYEAIKNLMQSYAKVGKEELKKGLMNCYEP